ncbi:hypothetical protein Cus16_0544 [Curtobacterium sp. ER1/6]|nr:hypothetical protein Cus16_0544 [Curtobacterium sp. ER1/6]
MVGSGEAIETEAGHRRNAPLVRGYRRFVLGYTTVLHRRSRACPHCC